MVAHDDRQEARDEDAEQAEEDQVVGWVGERTGIATVVDVKGNVPVHAGQREQMGFGWFME